jgi:glycine betaine/proline transport system substrate-binding protein
MSIPERRRTRCAIASAAACLVLTSCTGQPGDDDVVTIGYVPFDESVATSFLWKEILENQGYDVEMEEHEVTTAYQALASDEIDFFTGGTPANHPTQWDRYGDEFVDVGIWYDTLIQGLAVPTYTGLETISDLEGTAEEFNGQIVGIEADSGLMRQTEEDVPEVYDLSGFRLVEGGTQSMLASLDRAIAREEPIVVTLWQPHWAFRYYDLTLLEDDRGAYPTDDTYRVLASEEFSDDQEIVEQLESFHLEPDQLLDLESSIAEANREAAGERSLGGSEARAREAGVQEWISENQDLVSSWTAGAGD